nr:hypothetical protein [uncultured Arsenicibacter sp.]
MNSTISNDYKPSGALVNWVSVWGLIAAIVGFNLYTEYRQDVSSRRTYRAQIEAQNRAIDSLQAAKAHLNQRLMETKSALNQCQTSRTNPGTGNQSTMLNTGY